MPYVFRETQESEPRSAFEFPSLTSEVLTETFAQTFEENPAAAMLRAKQLADDYRTGKRIDAATARQRLAERGMENDITVSDAGITESALNTLMFRKGVEKRRQEVFGLSEGGLALGAARLGVGFATSLVDPLNVATAFIPVVGEARYANWLGRAGGFVGRTGVRAGVGALEGAAGAALVEPIIAGSRRYEQADYDMADSLLNVAFGGLFGSGLHTTFGAVSDGVRAYQGVRYYGLNEAPLESLSDAAQGRLRDSYYAASLAKRQLDPVIRKIADDLEAEVRTAGLKGTERAVEKTLADYAGDTSKLRDLTRGTIVVKSIDDVGEAIRRLREKFTIVAERNALDPNAAAISPDGYRDAKLNVRIGDTVAEVQINTPEMMAAKDAAHRLYERARAIDAKARAEGREKTGAEFAEIRALETEQRKVYGDAWDASLRKSASDTKVPLRKYESSGKGLPEGTSQAVTEYRDSETGTPSTSANRVPGGNEAGSTAITSSESVAKTAPIQREIELKQAVVDAVMDKPVNPAADAAELKNALTAADKTLAREVDTGTPTADTLKMATDEEALARSDLKALADRLGVEAEDAELREVIEASAKAERWAKAAELATVCLVRGG